MTSPRTSARHNLVIFWLAELGIPVLLIAGCVALIAINAPRP